MIKRNVLRGLSFLTNKSFNLKGRTVNPDTRQYWVELLVKITSPVLNALANENLKRTMPVATRKGQEQRKEFACLEAFSRSLVGLAPWLALGADNSVEGMLRGNMIKHAQTAIKNAVNPTSSDYLNFSNGQQPLVDAAFFAQALLRAPNQLWYGLAREVQTHVVLALKATRVISALYNNWLLFPAIIEAALLKFNEGGDRARIDYALHEHERWYLGDGIYGDGPKMRMDYYNSYVIQPMLLDIAKTVYTNDNKNLLDKIVSRAQRYAELQERFIAPDGSFPPIGRSITYRCGAFQLLAQMALHEALPKTLPPNQVRSALSAVINRTMEPSGTFDDRGWLQIGLVGHQPRLGEQYIDTGSLYLCSTAFLPLGLPHNNDFWRLPSTNWTSRKVFMGMNVKRDKPFDE